MIDKETGNSRGFGFDTYADPACINQVMASKPHNVFLGGISMEASEDDVREHFSKYGSVVEVNFVVDKTDSTRPHKGFGFVTFEDESSVDQAVRSSVELVDLR